MPVHCADCDRTFLLTRDGMTQTVACPDCGGKRLERANPSPVHSDGDLRDMVDPATGLDQGGNPLQEGIWAGVDGGWQPAQRRDESYASVKTAANDIPTTVGPRGIHHQVISLLNKLKSITVNGIPVNEANRNRIFTQYAMQKPTEPVMIGAHHPAFAQLASRIVTDSHGVPTPYKDDVMMLQQGIRAGQIPKPVEAVEEPAGAVPMPEPMALPGVQPMASVHVAFGEDDMDFDLGDWGDEGPSHLFAVNRGGQVFSTPYDPMDPNATHERLAEQHGLFSNDEANPMRGLTLGAIRPDGSAEFYQHETTHSPEALAQMLWGHFGHQVAVDPNLKPTTNEERWFGEGTTPEDLERMRQDRLRRTVEEGQLMTPEKRYEIQQAEKMRGRPFGYYDNPWINRGGSVKTTAAMGERTSNMEPYLPWAHEAAFLAPLAEGAGALLGGGGAAGAAAEGGGLLGGFQNALPFLMRGGLMGTGSHMVQGLLGGGGADGAAGQQPSMPPQPMDPSMLSHVKQADLETPHSNPDLHDNPDGDTHEFADQSTDTAFQNPNANQNGSGPSGADGEDNVGAGYGPDKPTFQAQSPALERAQMLLPLLLHYHNSEESGANDPLIRELHAMLDREVPGYLDNVDEEAGNAFLQGLRTPEHVHAMTKEAIGVYENTVLNPGQMQMGTGTQMALPNQPGAPVPQQAAQGRCPNCGSVTTADGSCPQCGMKVNAQGGAAPVKPAPITNGVQPVARVAGDTQGPETAEQIAAVQQLLIDQGRVDEVPNVPINPGGYAREMAQIAKQPNVAPNVDPNQTPPMPPQEQAPPGATMPVPNPADPSMQPTARTAADSYTARCPKCNSATTGLLNEDGEARCHSCGNIWKTPATSEKMGRRWAVIAADGDSHNDPNAIAVPAADQEAQRDIEQEQDSSHSWQDTDGNPLENGRIYEVHNPAYEIPDKVRVEKIRPDSITVKMVGQYENMPMHEIPLREVQEEQLTFVPDGEGDPSENYGPDNADAPVNTEPVQQPNVDEPASVRSHVAADAEDHDDREVHEDCDDDTCPKCSSKQITSSMSSPTTLFHECYRCGNAWETKEEEYGVAAGAEDRSWIMNESGPGDDFFAQYERVQAMREQGGSGSRSLASIAAKDQRLQAIKERLDANKDARVAGAKFTPREQREFIDEDGVARNADMLDLSGTHYESHRYLGDKANGMNVPDEHMFLGL